VKIFKIDSELRLITEVEVESIYPDAKHAVGISSMEAAFRWPNGDTLMVDEDGLLPPLNKHWFVLEDRHDKQPLGGNAFVCGEEREGDEYPDGYTTLDPKITLEQLTAKITWLTLDEAVLRLLAMDRPHSRISEIGRDGSVTVIAQTSWRTFLVQNGYPIPDGM
jgi:hypothetical protein